MQLWSTDSDYLVHLRCMWDVCRRNVLIQVDIKTYQNINPAGNILQHINERDQIVADPQEDTCSTSELPHFTSFKTTTRWSSWNGCLLEELYNKGIGTGTNTFDQVLGKRAFKQSHANYSLKHCNTAAEQAKRPSGDMCTYMLTVHRDTVSYIYAYGYLYAIYPFIAIHMSMHTCTQ